MADFDVELLYHPGRMNLAPDALSRRPAAIFLTTQRHLLEEMQSLGIEVVLSGAGQQCMAL